MKKVIRLTESELVNLVNKIIEQQEFDFEEDDFENEDEEMGVEDFGFDYDENEYDDEMQSALRRKAAMKRFKSTPMELPSGRPKKEDDTFKPYKPYSPIKSTDMDLDTYLRSKKGK